MENKEIFKVGDTVYHLLHGAGKVTEVVSSATYPIIVQFSGCEDSFTEDGRQSEDHPPTLSFTPYDFVNGGFSQERPIPDIEVDTLVYVRDRGEWNIRYFSHFGKDGYIHCFYGQKKSKDNPLPVRWMEWSLTNPLEEK